MAVNSKNHMKKKLKLFISVGEESADLHASRLCEALLHANPDIELFGFGGSKMKAAGVEILFPLPELALIGFAEVIKKLPKIFKIKKLAVKTWNEKKPDAILLVDFPGFHLRLAKQAHEMGIPVLYYIAPQVWAWREERVQSMKKTIDQLLVIFPFEERFFNKRGIQTKYVGHPLCERIVAHERMPQDTDILPEIPTIGLLPGSRNNELKYLLAVMIEAAKIVREIMPHVQFILPLAETLPEHILDQYNLPSWIEVCRDPTYERRKSLTFAWTCSGTATIENALLGIPMAVVFRTGKINIFLGRRFVRVPYIGMVNLIAQKGICPEFIQEQCQPKVLARNAEELLTNPVRYKEMKDDLQRVREKIGGKKTSELTAKEIISFLDKRECSS